MCCPSRPSLYEIAQALASAGGAFRLPSRGRGLTSALDDAAARSDRRAAAPGPTLSKGARADVQSAAGHAVARAGHGRDVRAADPARGPELELAAQYLRLRFRSEEQTSELQ